MRILSFILLIVIVACSTTKKLVPIADKYIIQTDQDTIPGSDIVFDLTFIHGGKFMMGSDSLAIDRNEDEGPQFEVTVGDFWMGTHELSFEEYDIYRNKEKDVATPQRPDWDADAMARPSPPYEDPTFGMGKDSVPAVSMTQFAALQYCKWLSDKTGVFYRLPSEAEWEYACKAGSDYGSDRVNIDELAWHRDNSSERYQKKANKKPNAWGLYDMLGNVSEWTLDQYKEDSYAALSNSTEVNPWTKPTRLHPRTVRGGSWDDRVSKHRCSCRIKSSGRWKMRDPQIPKSFWWNTDSPFVGFRLIKPMPQPTQAEREEFWELVLGDS